jgi:hypothetical protein
MFTVEGTLLEARASQRSFQAKEGKQLPLPDDPGNPTANFRDARRSNETHVSTTDPQSQMARKSEGERVQVELQREPAGGERQWTERGSVRGNGTAERDAALVMLQRIPGGKQVTVGGDKGFDTRDFVAECRHLGVTPNVAQKQRRGFVAQQFAAWFEN